MLDQGRAPPLNALHAVSLSKGICDLLIYRAVWMVTGKDPQKLSSPGLHKRLQAAHTDRGEVIGIPVVIRLPRK